MKAVIVHGPKDLRVEDIPRPEPGEGEVLVAMEWGGICGSDLAYWQTGVSGTAVLREPLVLGHEVAGRVAQIGPGVSGIEEGIPVTAHPASFVGDHEMPAELEHRTNLWPEVRYFGSAAFLPHEQGGFSEYRVVRADQLRVVPENLSTKEAALAEPFGVALHAINQAGDVKGKSLLVNGAGPIGLLAVAGLRAKGAAHVTVADLQETPLKIAKALGADELVNILRGDELPQDVEISIEASGAAAALGGILNATRRGGTVVQVGNLPGNEVSAVLGALVTREIHYVGAYRFVNEMADALELMAVGLDVSPVMTHEFPIDDAVAAFETAADHSTGSAKVMLKLG